jgi:hypothetical protein
MKNWPTSLLKGAAGVALASGWAPAARAEPGWTTDVGAYLAYHFGGGVPGRIAGGLEVRRLHGELDLGCEKTAYFTGGLARLELVGWDQIRLAVGPQVGKDTAYSEVAADLSLGLRFGQDWGLHVEPGFEGGLLSIMRARLAYAITRDFSAGGGLRLPRGFSRGCAIAGRPLRREGGRAMLPAVVLVDGPGPAPPDRQTRAMQAWAARASAEWASAPAFCELGAQLLACGAPPALADRARAAAEDEVRHAVVAGAVTAELGGQTVSLEPPALDRRPAVRGAPGLARLAVESWLDGCLGEGTAAASLAAEAEAARWPGLREAQSTVAADEARHAELAWDVLGWTLSVGGADLRSALAGAVAQPGEEEPALSGDDLVGLGCLPAEQRRAVAAGVRVKALKRLQSLTRT